MVQAVLALGPLGEAGGRASCRRPRASPARRGRGGEASASGVAPPSAPGAGVAVGVAAAGVGVGVRGDLRARVSASRASSTIGEHDGDQREREQHADDGERGAPAARLGDPGADGGAALQAPLLLGAQRRAAARAAPLDRGRRRRRLDAAHGRCSEATGSPRSVVGVVRGGSPAASAGRRSCWPVYSASARLCSSVGSSATGSGAGAAAAWAAAARSRSAVSRSAIARSDGLVGASGGRGRSAGCRSASTSRRPSRAARRRPGRCRRCRAGGRRSRPGRRRRARPRARAARRRSRPGAAALRSMMSLWPPCGAPAARWTS